MALKSFSIKIGADTTEFKKGLKEADRAIKSTIKETKALKESLKVEWSNDKFIQAQKLAQHALDLTKQKTLALKEQLKYLEDAGAVDTDAYNDLQLKLAQSQLEAEKLAKELKEINELKFTRFTNQINKVSEGLVKAGKAMGILSAAAAGIIVGIYKLGQNAAESGAEINDLATRLNITTEAVQRYMYIASQSATNSEQIAKGFVKVRDAMASINVGEVNSATKSIETLLGSLQDLSSDPEEAFNQIIIALSRVEDSTMQAYYAENIFGQKIATELIPLFEQGEDVLNELNAEFDELGHLSSEQVSKLAELDDSFSAMKIQITTAKNELAVALMPIIQEIVTFITERVIPMIQKIASWLDTLSPAVKQTILNGLAILAILSPVLLIGGKVLGLVTSFIGSLPKLATLIAKLATPLGRVMIALVAIGAIVKMINDVSAVWADMNAVQKIVSVLGILTVAVLGAAVAFGAFHSAWSLGLAVAGIIAGIVAVTAAVNDAKNSIDTSIPDVSSPSITNSADYQLPDYSGYAAVGTTTNNNDNSQVVNNITINAENASAEEVYDIIARRLAIKIQARS